MKNIQSNRKYYSLGLYFDDFFRLSMDVWYKMYFIIFLGSKINLDVAYVVKWRWNFLTIYVLTGNYKLL
jgi:hypothetical protein